MKKIVSVFKDSAAELKNVRCLTFTGILAALFVILDILSFRPVPYIKLNFNFIAVAAAGMLFGPVPAAMTAVSGDLIGCILSGQAPILPLTVTAALEGLVYGALLYRKRGIRLVTLSIIARVIDSGVICLLLNTAILMQFGFMSRTRQQFILRYGAVSTELILYIFVIMTLLPAVRVLYEHKHNSHM